MKSISQITKAAEKYSREVEKTRKPRLRKLVETHGIDAVVAATGWTEGTIRQYLRTKTLIPGEWPLQVAENTL